MNVGAELTRSASLGSQNETGLLKLSPCQGHFAREICPKCPSSAVGTKNFKQALPTLPIFSPFPLADSKSPGTETPLMSGVCVGTPDPFRRRLARLWKMSQNEHRTCGAGRCEEEEVCLLCLSSHRKTVPASPALQPKTNKKKGCSLPCVVWTDDSQAMVF